MDNYDLSASLGFYAKLLELHDENPFKVKAYAAAAFNIKKVKEPLSEMSVEQLKQTPGVGKSVLSTIQKLIETGEFPELSALMSKTPEGVVAMLKIKGLGPKKVQVIWRQMGVESVEDLFDTCRENRLVELPGFGYKTQSEIMHSIEFAWAAAGKIHFARAEKPAMDILTVLKNNLAADIHETTGDFRRAAEVLEFIEVLTTSSESEVADVLSRSGYSKSEHYFHDKSGFKFLINHCSKPDFARRHFELTGNAAHLFEVGYSLQKPFTTESDFYESAGLPFLEPELREGLGEVSWAKNHNPKDIIEFSNLKGILHNHTTYSDGLHSLREMAEYCRSKGYEYLGICDHSKSAGYANGLSVERVLQQHEEIDALNAEMAPFKIFKGIESDILNDGSLDYEPQILAKFDFVVASIHSNLHMNQEKAMERLLAAIANPYTSILGHPTGRLLLVRNGYPIDHKVVIDACAKHNVCIELNANPYRLDIDWRWIQYALEQNVVISINPDAHEKQGFYDMYYGTLAARKGRLTKAFTLNAKTKDEFTEWLKIQHGKTGRISLQEHNFATS